MALHVIHFLSQRQVFVLIKYKCGISSAYQVCCTYTQSYKCLHIYCARKLGRQQPGLPPCHHPKSKKTRGSSLILPFPSHTKQLLGAGQKQLANTSSNNYCTVLGAVQTWNPSKLLSVTDRQSPARFLNCWPCPADCKSNTYQESPEKNICSVVSVYLPSNPPSVLPMSAASLPLISEKANYGSLGGELTKAMLQQDCVQLG